MDIRATARGLLLRILWFFILWSQDLSSALAVTPGGYPMPSLQAERDAYTRWGWTWKANAEPNAAPDSAYTVRDPDIHGDTEGDDLWTYLMMYLRTGQQGYLDRAKAWARYF